MLASACMLRLYNGGRSRGQTPRTPNTFYTNTTNPMTIDTVTRVNTPLVNHHQMKICHIINDATSARWYGPPRGRTNCTDRYSQHPIFYLFDLAVKSRYLLHTDSIRENKYTAGIRKTGRTQWHFFRFNPSTLKIEQILIP